LTGGRCSEVDLVPKLLGRDLGRSLLTGGCYSEVVVSTSLTVNVSMNCIFMSADCRCRQIVLSADCLLADFRSADCRNTVSNMAAKRMCLDATVIRSLINKRGPL
jgi:hypothetical protein